MASTGEVWKLGHRPALDGVRGIAVLLVVVGHALERIELPWRPNFGLGVTVFFVLSGFLITSLLLEERGRSGRVNLWAFYLRRARRLLPALVVMLALTLALGLVTWQASTATLFYVANWHQAATLHAGGLAHTWSLAVEEQFYLVWPLVVIGCSRFPRRVLLWVAIGGAVASFTARAVLYTPESAALVQRWTHTAADPILLGCALAITMHGRSVRRVPPKVTVAATVALLGAVLTAGYLSPIVQPTEVAVLSVAVVYAVCSGEYVGWLAARPLRHLGQRSYALYLWHVPTLTLGTAVGLDGMPRVVLGVGLAVVLAELSWRYVERPFLRRSADLAEIEVRRAGGKARSARGAVEVDQLNVIPGR